MSKKVKNPMKNENDFADTLNLHDEVVFEEVLYRTHRHFEKILQGILSKNKAKQIESSET